MPELRNVILCGFMGSGKSTVGPLLADRVRKLSIDLDHYIEIRRNTTIPEIFRLEGEQGFRDEEHAALCDLLNQRGFVVGVGGGTLAYERNIDALTNADRILLLDPGFDVCYARIVHSDRPLVRQNSREALREIYNTRMALFSSVAHHTVTNTSGPQAVAEEAAALLLTP